MSAESIKMSAQFGPALAMSAQSPIMSSQSIKSVTNVRSISKDVRPISPAPHDVRAIPNYLLLFHPTPLQNSIFPQHLVTPPNTCYIKFNNIQKEVDTYQNNAKKRTTIIKNTPKTNHTTPKRFTAY